MSMMLLERPAHADREEIAGSIVDHPWLRLLWAGPKRPKRPDPRRDDRRPGSDRKGPGHVPDDPALPARVGSEGARPRSRVRTPGPVLIVEDNPMIRATLGEVLRSQGLDVVAAASIEAGMRIALREHPSAIVLDVRLPDGSGIALARRLKRHKATADVPVIVLTAAVTDADRADAAALGVKAYLSKPPDLPAIVRMIVDLTTRGLAAAMEDDDDDGEGSGA